MVETAKIASALILFGLASFSGIISCLAIKCLVNKLDSSTKFKRVISILNCFSGGVFFATSVLSLLPEARESMEHALESFDVSSEYPFTELTMCVGFFLILTLEHFAHSRCTGNTSVTKPVNNFHHQEKLSKSQTIGSMYSEPTVGYTKSRSHDGLVPGDHILICSDLEDSSFHDDMTYQTYGTVDESIDKTSVRPYSIVPSKSESPELHEVVFQDSDRILIRQSSKLVIESNGKSTHDALEEAKRSANIDPARSRLRGLVLLIALSLHMIFDGLALGLLKESHKVWELLAALSLHKVLVFFTVGVQTLEILTSLKKTIIVIFIFALMSPFGIIIAESINLSGDSVTKDVLSAVLQGIATGTFLFVTFFEILQRELGSDDHDLLKVFITVIGFVLVAAVRLLEHGDQDS